jgi:hypothetical protein
LTNGRRLAHNASVLMIRPAFSGVIQHYQLAIGVELCSEAAT